MSRLFTQEAFLPSLDALEHVEHGHEVFLIVAVLKPGLQVSDHELVRTHQAPVHVNGFFGKESELLEGRIGRTSPATEARTGRPPRTVFVMPSRSV